VRHAALATVALVVSAGAIAYDKAMADVRAPLPATEAGDRQGPVLAFSMRLTGSRCKLESSYGVPTAKPFRYRGRLTVQWRNPPSRIWHSLATSDTSARDRPRGQPPLARGRAYLTVQLGWQRVRRLIAHRARFRAVTVHRLTVDGEALPRERVRHALRLKQCELGIPIRRG
jgi:hypothetical protein